MKTVDEIYEEMLASFIRQTGAGAAGGCDLPARLYAVAAQVYALQVQADWVRRQAFPQTAQGEYLDLHAEMRGLRRKSAARAEGTVRFSAERSDRDRTIPRGTVCMTAGMMRFQTTEDGAIPAGSTSADVKVQALEAGAAGNVLAGTVTVMASAPVGVASCTNPAACAGGCDAEEDETLRERVLDTYTRLPNGANSAYYQQQAMSFEQVAACCVLPRNRGVGTVDVVVATPSGVPGKELLDELTDYFNVRREISVDVSVLPPKPVTVNLTVKVKPEAGGSLAVVKTAVAAAVTGWFTGQRLGQSVLLAQLTALVFACPGVANCTVTAPAADVAIQADELPVLGTLTVEELT